MLLAGWYSGYSLVDVPCSYRESDHSATLPTSGGDALRQRRSSLQRLRAAYREAATVRESVQAELPALAWLPVGPEELPGRSGCHARRQCDGWGHAEYQSDQAQGTVPR